jgi:hypothetical protein
VWKAFAKELLCELENTHNYRTGTPQVATQLTARLKKSDFARKKHLSERGGFW